MKLVLEPRYLFDGSVAPVTKPVVDAHHETTQASDALHADSSLVAEHGIATEPVTGGGGAHRPRPAGTTRDCAHPQTKGMIFVDPPRPDLRAFTPGGPAGAPGGAVQPP